MNEFRNVPDFEGYYECSIVDGAIYSVARDITYSDGRVYHYNRRLRKPTKLKGRGHLEIVLSKNGVNYHTYVQDVVAKTFPEICGTWFPGCIVHHIDGNPLNNNPHNLVVLSRGQHALEHIENLEVNRCHFQPGHPNFNKGPYKTGESHWSSKLILVYTVDYEVIGCYGCLREAADALGCSFASISHNCLGKSGPIQGKYNCEYL